GRALLAARGEGRPSQRRRLRAGQRLEQPALRHQRGVERPVADLVEHDGDLAALRLGDRPRAPLRMSDALADGERAGLRVGGALAGVADVAVAARRVVALAEVAEY